MARGPKCRRGEEVGDESADNGVFGYNLVLEDAIADLETGHKAAGVDVEIPGFAWAVEGNNDLFVGNVEGFESDVGAMSPGAAMIGVESYWDIGKLWIRYLSRGGQVLLGPMPLLVDAPSETFVMVEADILL